MKRKLVTLALFASLTVAMFAGCGARPTASSVSHEDPVSASTEVDTEAVYGGEVEMYVVEDNACVYRDSRIEVIADENIHLEKGSVIKCQKVNFAFYKTEIDGETWYVKKYSLSEEAPVAE